MGRNREAVEGEVTDFMDAVALDVVGRRKTSEREEKGSRVVKFSWPRRKRDGHR